MLAAEDHRLLMEALMLFSPGADHDDRSSSSVTCTLESPSGVFLLARAPAKPRPSSEGRSSPDAKAQGDSTSTAAASRPAPPISSSLKAPLRRKRAKKCTYAARREEVARLRSWTTQLEAQLGELQKRLRSRGFYRERARTERDLLSQSRAELACLRALAATNHARIQEQSSQTR